ncbi:MAG TPA: response regulator transcription factor [Chitinophagaceae bacterium]|nr:response regulator transcription factor [Chitinophagaceae bacterium]
MSKNITQIALVDDHTLLRNGLASIVQSFEGYAVLFEAGNGKDFIQQLKTYDAPDIVLLDINMPEMDGFETADWIKQNLPSAKILVLSVMDTDTIIINMLKKGARGYILKDSKPAIFKQALDNIRDSGFYMNELVSNKMFSYVLNEEEKGKEAFLVANLSSNEKAFLKMVCSEMTYKEIAQEMKLSPRTVDGYRDDLLKKLKVQSRIGLVIFAIKYGIYKL